MSMSAIEEYYDAFSARFIRDYVYGNARVQQQMAFLSMAIPRDAQSVLVIGCGGGQASLHIANHCVRKARILAIDISSQALQIARAICSHPRVEYRQADVFDGDVEGRWEVIVLPDVYEHIPSESRNALHQIIARLLSDHGRVLLTCPSPFYQEYLRRMHPEELQLIDEIVTLEDLLALARDAAGYLSYFNVISVWRRNDYVHAIIERDADRMDKVTDRENLRIKQVQRASLVMKMRRYCLRASRLDKLVFWMRYRRIQRTLRRLQVSETHCRDQSLQP